MHRLFIGAQPSSFHHQICRAENHSPAPDNLEVNRSFQSDRNQEIDVYTGEVHDDERLPVTLKPFPIGLVVAVWVDALVDGFLIGIASASGNNAGQSVFVQASNPTLLFPRALHKIH